MTADPSLQVIAPDSERHHDEMFDLIAKVFPMGNYFRAMGVLQGGYVDHSHYDYAASRIGLLDGKIVTHFGVWDYQMRIGKARVRTGGIGVVATHGDFRKRGFMDQTARASIAAMRALGYDVTILFGIWDFYHKFGYTRAWSDTTHVVPLKQLPKLPDGVGVERFRPEPREDLARVFNRYFATTTGTAVRPNFRKRFHLGDEWEGLLWRDARGGVAGYAFVNVGTGLTCHELVGDIETGLAVLAAEGEKRGATEVRFEKLPAESALGRRLRRGTVRLETQHIGSGGAMIRVVNLRQTLEKMTPELERRLAGEAFRGDVVIGNGEETVTLAIARGKLNVRAGGRSAHAIRGGDAIAQLLIGTDDPLVICEQHRIRLTGEAKRLVETLFPVQHPMLHLADRY